MDAGSTGRADIAVKWLLNAALIAALVGLIYVAVDNLLFLFLVAYGRGGVMGAFFLFALYAIVIGSAIKIVADIVMPRPECPRSDDLRFRNSD